ncbi:hypothetical protein RSOL_407320 [Rhizoctonia solani AG-3 Rhs1AP]|uniref:Uncharacterized protein n=1 Tax=Rhizoctonia solani AG-3 Rhs1AP TaxID=1086054 RepID=X8JFT4_9AGAM|nr:hypothetical protein RSOL_407320 [Rhizoctonia solani AG-3 Rhs1AP]
MPVQFDPKIHLAYAPPESRIMMADLGKAGEGIAPPFPLLSEEGVRTIREEIFSSHILDRCTHTTDPACQIRGMSCRPGFASFNEALWTHSETIRVVSEAAGIDLVPIIPYEGGETALACADGSVRKIRGPQMGWAIMLQGRYIDHAALSAYSAPERVTMVTSYRARDVMVADDSVLTTVRRMANLNELYYEWSTYRLDLLSERFRHQSKVLKKKREDGQGQWGEEIVKKDELKAWCREQIKYLQTTIDEMV